MAILYHQHGLDSKSMLSNTETILAIACSIIAIIACLFHIFKHVKKMYENCGTFKIMVTNQWKGQVTHVRFKTYGGVKSKDIRVEYQGKLNFPIHANFLGMTHYWCVAHAEKDNGEGQPKTYYVRTFPVFSKGARSGNNYFELTENGIEENGAHKWNWAYDYSGQAIDITFYSTKQSIWRQFWNYIPFIHSYRGLQQDEHYHTNRDGPPSLAKVV